MWGLCHAFENTLYVTRDLVEDSGVLSNLSVPKVPELDQVPLLPVKGPKPREHDQLFCMKRDRNKGFYSEKC